MAAVATTERRVSRRGGPDGVTVTMLTLAVFLVILAVLASGMRGGAAAPGHPMVVVRRVYETRVVETIVGGSKGGSSVTQSVSSSAGTTGSVPSTTRAS